MAEAPKTLPEITAALKDELEAVQDEIEQAETQLRRKRERAAYLRGRIDSYASLQIIENPATLETGSDE